MAIKFSQFVVETSASTLSHIVGYDGADNIQITPNNFFTSFVTGTTGQVPFFGSTTSLLGDAEFNWDNTNKRLGIGTISPNYRVHIEDNSVTTGSKTLLQLQSDPINNGGSLNLDFRVSSANTDDRYVARISGMREGNGALSQLQFWTESSGLYQRMTITSAGNVGIGTTSPGTTLDVAGTLASSGITQLGTGGSNVLLTSASAGNVGIGTASPAYKLEVAGDIKTSGDIIIDNSSGDPFLKLKTTAQEYVLRIDQSDSEKFQIRNVTSSVTALSIDTSSNATFTGNVDLPDNKKVQLGASQDLKLYHDGNDSIIQDSGTGVLKIITSGVAFKNESTANTLVLDSSGNATFAGDIKQGTRIVLQDNGTIQWGANADYGNLSWDTGYALIYGQSGKGIKFGTNGSTLALTLDTSQNATFAGGVGVNMTPTTDYALTAKSLIASGGYTILAYNSDGERMAGFYQTTTKDGELYLKSDGDVSKVKISSSADSYFNGGNVGIGTTSPQSGGGAASWLSLNGTAAYSGGIVYTISSTTKAYSYFESDYLKQQAQSGFGQKFIVDGTNTAMTILNSGNVGIGTDSPTSKLHVDSGGSDNVARFVSADLRARVEITDSADASYFGTINGITFLGPDDTSGGNNINITNAGNVGIGTNSPSEKLQINNGRLRFLESGQRQYNIGIVSGTSDFAITDATFSSERMRINSSGNVGIGSTSPTSKLTVVGLAEHADNAAAISAGLTTGAFYRTGDLLKVVH